MCELLGKGSFANVYKARKKKEFKLKTDPDVFAMKVCEIDTPDSAANQVEPLFQLKNRNCSRIVRCYYCFLGNDFKMYIAMEYCPYTQTTYINLRQNRGNIEVYKRIFLQCLEGLKYLHEQKILHRDIKPENILIDYEGDAKLCDFNVMKEMNYTMAKTQVGTPLYTAPEVYQGKYNESADIWSLCASFYKILHGEAPYFNENVDSAIALAINKLDMVNYEKLTQKHCSDSHFRDIINNICANTVESRPKLDFIYDSIHQSSTYKSNYKSKLFAEEGQSLPELGDEPEDNTMGYSKSDFTSVKRQLNRRDSRESRGQTALTYTQTNQGQTNTNFNFSLTKDGGIQMKELYQKNWGRGTTNNSVNNTNTGTKGSGKHTEDTVTYMSEDITVGPEIGTIQKRMGLEGTHNKDIMQSEVFHNSFDQKRQLQELAPGFTKTVNPTESNQIFTQYSQAKANDNSTHTYPIQGSNIDSKQTVQNSKGNMDYCESPRKVLMNKADIGGWASISGSKFRMRSEIDQSQNSVNDKQSNTPGISELNIIDDNVIAGMNANVKESYADSLEMGWGGNRLHGLKNSTNNNSGKNSENSSYNLESYNALNNKSPQQSMDMDLTLHERLAKKRNPGSLYNRSSRDLATSKSNKIDQQLQEQEESLDSQPQYYGEKSSIAFRNARFDQTHSNISNNSKAQEELLALKKSPSDEYDKTINPKGSDIYNPAYYEDTIIMEDSIAPTLIGSIASRYNTQQKGNFINGGQSSIGEGVIMGQSRDTNFGISRAEITHSNANSSRFKPTMRDMGESRDMGTQTTSQDMRDLRQKHQQRVNMEQPRINVINNSSGGSLVNPSDWKGTNYYDNLYKGNFQRSKEVSKVDEVSMVQSSQLSELTPIKSNFQRSGPNMNNPSFVTCESVYTSHQPENNQATNFGKNNFLGIDGRNLGLPPTIDSSMDRHEKHDQQISKFLDRMKKQKKDSVDIYEDDFEDEPKQSSPVKFSEEYDQKFLGKNQMKGVSNDDNNKVLNQGGKIGGWRNSDKNTGKKFLDQVKETIGGEDRDDTILKGISLDYEEHIEENMNFEEDFEDGLFDEVIFLVCDKKFFRQIHVRYWWMIL